MRISDCSSDVCSADLPGDDEVLIGRQAESTAVDAGNVPQTIHQLAYKTAILNEQREVMTTIRCLRPTIAIAIGFEVERTGQFECFTHALPDFGLDPVKTLRVDGIFKAGVQPLLALAIVALHSHDGIRAGRAEERRQGQESVSP